MTPKCDLHLHFGGIVSPRSLATAFMCKRGNEFQSFLGADRYNRYLRFTNLYNLIADGKIDNAFFSFESFENFVSSFSFINRLFDSPELLQLLANDLIGYIRQQHITYAEITLSPLLYTQNKMTTIDFFRIIVKTFNAVDINVKFIIDCAKSTPIDEAISLIDLANKELKGMLCGITLGGRNSGDLLKYIPLFNFASDIGIAKSIHLGEDSNLIGLENVISLLHLDRIAHGIGIHNSTKLMQMMIAKNIALEVCPSSNISNKLIKTPNAYFADLFKLNIPIIIGSDDPTFFKTTITKELWYVFECLHFSEKKIYELLSWAINAFK